MTLAAALVAPLAVQSAAMAFDELYFHRKRGLGPWERIGHPLDTLTVVACLAWAMLVPPTPRNVAVYVTMAIVSCLFVTKDEAVHARECTAGEHWLHAVLFVVHPVALGIVGLLWPSLHGAPTRDGLGGVALARGLVGAQLGLATTFALYQAVYWAAARGADRSKARPVNNAFYQSLEDRWYEATDHPIALLRSESSCRLPWIVAEARERVGDRRLRVLDLGCGAGFLANALAAAGHDVTGIDASEASLAVAARHDATGAARYVAGDVRRLPFGDESFDVVCAMDLLEHVERPADVVAQAARVLAPGGCFFFHTFNRNWLAWLVVVKGVEWLVANTPRDLHVARLFLKPREVRAMCEAHGLELAVLRGFEPVLASTAFLRMAATRRVPRDFRFRFTRSTRIAYSGIACKPGAQANRAA